MGTEKQDGLDAAGCTAVPAQWGAGSELGGSLRGGGSQRWWRGFGGGELGG